MFVGCENETDIEKTKRLAEEGDAQAQYELALMFDMADGLPEYKDLAFQWCSKSAKQGHVEAQYYLGLKYANGNGATKDSKQAAE